MRGQGVYVWIVWCALLLGASPAVSVPTTLQLPMDGTEVAHQLPWHGLGATRAGAVGTRVAVIDTRIAADEARALGVAIARVESQRPSRGGRPDWHGRWVAGVLAGKVAGACPGCQVLALGTLFADATGEVVTDDAHIARAIDRARRLDARVINLSLGGAGVCTPVLTQAVRRALDAGIVVVAAAGNDMRQRVLECPANVPGVVSVGALAERGTLQSLFAQTIRPTIWAMGESVVGGRAARDRDVAASGSSFAAPIVAGTIAEWIGRFGAPRNRRGVAQLTARLRATATPSSPGLPTLDAGAFLGDPDAAVVWRTPSEAGDGISEEVFIELRGGGEVAFCTPEETLQVYPLGGDGVLAGTTVEVTDATGRTVLGPQDTGQWRFSRVVHLRKDSPGRAVIHLMLASHTREQMVLVDRPEECPAPAVG